MKGLIHIYCGDGKGKTTSSLGLVLRACGNDFNVIFAVITSYSIHYTKLYDA